jgi:hypothetical protein
VVLKAVLVVVNQLFYVRKLLEDEELVVEHQLIHLLDNQVVVVLVHQVVIVVVWVVDVVEVIVKNGPVVTKSDLADCFKNIIQDDYGNVVVCHSYKFLLRLRENKNYSP